MARALLIALGLIGLFIAILAPAPPYQAEHRRPSRRSDRRQRQLKRYFGRRAFKLGQDAWDTADWARWNLYIRTACVVSHRA